MSLINSAVAPKMTIELEKSHRSLARARGWEDAVELLRTLNYLAQHTQNVADVSGYLKSSEDFLVQLVDILREN